MSCRTIKIWVCLAQAMTLALAFAPSAQAQNPGLFASPPSGGLPVPANRGNIFSPDSVLSAPPNAPLAQPSAPGAPSAMPVVPAGQAALALSARFGKEAPAIPGGLTWR